MGSILTLLGTWKLKILAGLGIILVAVGIYFAGHTIGLTKGKAESAVAISKYEKNVADLQTQVAQKQIEIQTVTVDKYHTVTNTIHDTADATTQVIEKNVPTQYNLSKGWIYTHDQAALGLPADSKLASDATPSEYKDKDVLTTINSNYAKVCQDNAAQLTALQDWVNQTYASVNANQKTKKDSK